MRGSIAVCWETLPRSGRLNFRGMRGETPRQGVLPREGFSAAWRGRDIPSQARRGASKFRFATPIITAWSVPLKVWTGNKEDDRLSSRGSARREWALPKLVGAGRGRFRCAGSRVEPQPAFPSR
jgi:hypothetical protein